MTPRKFKRVTKKMVFKRYDSILVSVKQVERAYGVKRIPLEMLKKFIDAAMIENSKDPNFQTFVKHFNKTLDSIYLFSIDNGKLFGDNCVSFMELKQWIDALKAAFIKGQNQPHDQEYN